MAPREHEHPLADSPISEWLELDRKNSAPVAAVRLRLPGGRRVTSLLRINYNIAELRQLLAVQLRLQPDQLEVLMETNNPAQSGRCTCRLCDDASSDDVEVTLEAVADYLPLAGLDVEQRDVCLHVRMRTAVDSAPSDDGGPTKTCESLVTGAGGGEAGERGEVATVEELGPEERPVEEVVVVAEGKREKSGAKGQRFQRRVAHGVSARHGRMRER